MSAVPDNAIQVATGSHIGLVHHTNEDSLVTFETEEGARALVICDGMGGMGRGDEASRIAVDVIREELQTGIGFAPDRMRAAVCAADVKMRAALSIPGNTPGSTAVMVYVENALAHVCWAGDSRAYLIRDGRVLERTRDHKLVTELVEAGELTEEEARNSNLAHVVTKALGGRGPAEPVIQPDVIAHPWKLQTEDFIVLCSDGLCDLVQDDELPSYLLNRTEEEAVEALTTVALERGGHDNITIIVARWTGPDFDEEQSLTPVMGMRSDGDAAARHNNETWTPLEDVEAGPEVMGTTPASTPEPAPSKPATPPPPPVAEPAPNRAMALGIVLVALVLIALVVLAVFGAFSPAEVAAP